MRMPDAAERKVLIVTTLVSAFIALAPQEWPSFGVLLVASVLMLFNDLRLTKRESAAKTSVSMAVADPAEPLAETEEPASIGAEPAPHAEPAPPPPAI